MLTLKKLLIILNLMIKRIQLILYSENTIHISNVIGLYHPFEFLFLFFIAH